MSGLSGNRQFLTGDEIKLPVPPRAELLQACQGVDLLFSTHPGTAFEFKKNETTKEREPFNFGFNKANPSFSFDVSVHDITKIMTSDLSVDVSATFGLGLFEGSDEAKYSESASFNERIIRVLLRGRAVFSQSQLDQSQLAGLRFSDMAKSSIKDRTFRDNFGDAFVFGCTKGACLTLAVTIKCSDEQTKNEVSNDFKAGTSLSHVDVKALLKGTAQRKGVEVDIQESVQGPIALPPTKPVDPSKPVDSSNPIDPYGYLDGYNESYRKFLESWDPESKVDKLAILEYQLRKYSALKSYQQVSSDLISDLEQLQEEFEKDNDRFQPLARRYLAYVAISNTLEDIKTHSFRFDCATAQPTLDDQIVKCAKFKKQIIDEVHGYVNKRSVGTQQRNVGNASSDEPLEDPNDLAKNLPKPLKYYFLVSSITDPGSNDKCAEIQYKAWNGSLWSVTIINGQFRQRPIIKGGAPTDFPPRLDIRWQIPYIYPDGPKEHQNYWVQLLLQNPDNQGIFSHWDSYLIAGLNPPDNGWRTQSNSIRYIDDNEKFRFATICLSDA